MPRTLCLLAPMLALGLACGAVLAGDLPVTAEDGLAGRALRPEEHFLSALPVKMTAVLPDGVRAPGVNVLGPIAPVPSEGGSFAIPPCWLYVVESAAPPGSGGLDLGKLVEWARDLEVPGLSLRMQPRVDDAFVERLVGLDTLLYLGLGRTRVTDTALAHAARLPKLLGLELDGVVGISDAGLAHLVSHPSLVALRLEGARGVTDARAVHLASIPNLIWLDLAQTSISDDGLAALAKPGLLRVIDLRQCTGVTDDGIGALAKLKNLRWLSLNALPVGDKAVAWLKGSKHLEVLDLTDTEVTVKGLRTLRDKGSLRELMLRGPMLTDEGLAIVATCSGLQRLYLHNAAGVTDEGLAHLSALSKLETFGISAAPQVTDASLTMLGKKTSLTWLSLDRCTGLTKEGVRKLETALPACQVIDPWRLGIK